MQKIKIVKAREILDSRGKPTIEVDILFDNNILGRASIPSGASTGSHEAIELRDGDKARYGGKGVLKAVKNVNETISGAICNKSFDQKSLDDTLIALDGTPNKSRLGANAILGVSLAFSKARAKADDIPLYKYFQNISDINRQNILPIPMMNFVNGGRHADNSSDFQEYMVVPRGFTSFKEAIRAGSEIFDALHNILKDMKLATTVGDEGGFAPCFETNEKPLTLMMEATIKAGYKPGQDIFFALDVASSEFMKDDKYILTRENKTLSNIQLIDYYQNLTHKYPIVSIEDGLGEDDWDGHKDLTQRLGSKIQLVGDDLFVTNIHRLEMGIQKGVANSILIKPNQIGTISETIDTVKKAYENNYSAIISHRSGETEDTTISHLAVGLGTGQIKTGSVTRTERTCKYNELLRIEEELGKEARYG